MKYLKFTYVDVVTGVSVATEPAMNGTQFPGVVGLQFVWARESAYPTAVPEFFGTCPDDSDTGQPGVIGAFVEADYNSMHDDELNARIPQSVTIRQGRRALLDAGYIPAIDAFIASLPSPQKEQAQNDWEYASTIERGAPLTATLAAVLGLDKAAMDALFVKAKAHRE